MNHDGGRSGGSPMRSGDPGGGTGNGTPDLDAPSMSCKDGGSSGGSPQRSAGDGGQGGGTGNGGKG